MNTELPTVIADFFVAHNTGQTSDFASLFAGSAVVRDESHEYRQAAIKQWMDGAIASYKPIAQTTDVTTEGDQTIVTAQVSGNFPGSPTQLRYRFTVRDAKIASLSIGP